MSQFPQRYSGFEKRSCNFQSIRVVFWIIRLIARKRSRYRWLQNVTFTVFLMFRWAQMCFILWVQMDSIYFEFTLTRFAKNQNLIGLWLHLKFSIANYFFGSRAKTLFFIRHDFHVPSKMRLICKRLIEQRIHYIANSGIISKKSVDCTPSDNKTVYYVILYVWLIERRSVRTFYCLCYRA